MPKTTMFLIPGPGLVVRDPTTGRMLKPEGDTVARSAYWLRRIKDGSVTVGRPAARTAAPAPKPSDKKE